MFKPSSPQEIYSSRTPCAPSHRARHQRGLIHHCNPPPCATNLALPATVLSNNTQLVLHDVTYIYTVYNLCDVCLLHPFEPDPHPSAARLDPRLLPNIQRRLRAAHHNGRMLTGKDNPPEAGRFQLRCSSESTRVQGHSMSYSQTSFAHSIPNPSEIFHARFFQVFPLPTCFHPSSW